jgi:hypothetical protein
MARSIYDPGMTLDPHEERERVHTEYAPMRGRDVGLWSLGVVALVVASLWVSIGWYFVAGIVTGLIAWELTKLKLRRQADQFAARSKPLG